MIPRSLSPTVDALRTQRGVLDSLVVALVVVVVLSLFVPTVGAQASDQQTGSATVEGPATAANETNDTDTTGETAQEEPPGEEPREDDPADEEPRDAVPPEEEEPRADQGMARFVDENGDVKTTVNTNGSNTDARLLVSAWKPYTPIEVSSDRLTARQLFRIFAGRPASTVPNDAVPGDLGDATTVNGVAMYANHVEGSNSKIVIVDSTTYNGSTVTFEETSAADYVFEFAAVNRPDGWTGTANISVVEEPYTASFGKPLYETTAGDLVTVTVSFQNTDAGYVMIGGDKRTGGTGLRNYLDILYVENGATFTINTRLVGTDVPSSAVYRPQSGTVVSYAHTYGPTTDPEATAEFDDLSFETVDGKPVADTLAEFERHVGIGELPRPLRPARYRLVAGTGDDIVVRNDGVPDFRHSLARSNLRLVQPGIGTAATYTGPSANADRVQGESSLPGGVVESSNVTLGDRLVVEFGGNGTMGAMTDITGDPQTAAAANLTNLLALRDRQEGVNLTITEVDPGVNTEPNRVDFETAAPQDVVLLTKPGPEGKRLETFYLVIDTRHRRPFEGKPEPGETYRVEFTYELPAGEQYEFQETGPGELPPAFAPANEPADDGTEHFPYVTEERTATTTFTFEKPRIEYDQLSTQGRLVLEPTAGARLSGTTNMAPGTPYWIHVVAGEQEPTRTISTTQGTVSGDGSFGTSVDLSTLEPGETIDVEFYTSKPTAPDQDQRFFDEQRGVVVANGSAPAHFEITNMTAETNIEQGESLSNVSATIRNTGSVEGQQNVTLTIENETVASQVELLRTNESVTYTYDTVFPNRDPGTYNVTLATGTDTQTGALTVEGAGETTPTATPAPGATATRTRTPTPVGTGSQSQSGTETPATSTPGTPTNSNETPSEDSQESALPIPPLGAQRTRDALGATVIVGGAYLVDYFL